jgi:RHS repeat-associated protein
VVQESQTITGGGTFVTKSAYNSADMLIAITYPGDNVGNPGEKLTYAYYNQGSVKSIWSDLGTPGTSTDDYYYLQQGVYDASGRTRSLWLGGTYQVNQPTVQNQYSYFDWTIQDGLGRLKQITAGTSADPDSLLDLRYYSGTNDPAYDASGNLDNIYRYTNGTTLLETQSFDFDTLNRLVSGGADGSASYSETYGYDTSTGNLNSKSSLGSYTYSATRQGTCSTGTSSTIKHAVSAAGSNSYQYDCNGNMITRVVGGQTYNLSYDTENRMTGVSGAATANFAYDVNGARVKSVVNGTTTYFVGEMLEWTGSTNTMKLYYSLGGKKIAMRTGAGGTLNWMIGDHLGSTTVTADAGGSSPTVQLYRAWGEVRTGTGNGLATRYTYTGQADDGIGGLMYYRARWLDNQLGRFAQADTAIPGAGSPLAWDHYAAMNNNAVQFADPTGHFAWLPVIALPGAVVGAAVSYGSQVANNLQSNGGNWASAMTTNINVGEVVQAAAATSLAAVSVAILAPVVVAAAGEALVGAGMMMSATSSVGGGLISTGMSTIGAATAMTGALYGVSAASQSFSNCSFRKDTSVVTNEGNKEIGSIQQGDKVLAWNEANNAIGYYPVTDVLVHEDETLVELVIDGEWIETTPEHPFYTEEEGWLPAEALAFGMHVRQANGSEGMVWLSGRSLAPRRCIISLSLLPTLSLSVRGSGWCIMSVVMI